MEKVARWLKTVLFGTRTPATLACGECPRTEQCGLPPNADCLVKLDHLERQPGYARPRMVG